MRPLILTVLLLLLFSGQAIAESGTSTTEEPNNSTALIITGGCVGGALIGSAVPIFGNIAGCVIGGFASWWYNGD